MQQHTIISHTSAFAQLRHFAFALILLFMGMGNRLQAQGYEIPFRPAIVNHSSPDNRTNPSVEEEVEVVWVLDKASKFASEYPDFEKVSIERIRLMVQFELGAPHVIANLHSGNNPRELSVRLRMADYEHMLPRIDLETYGDTFTSGTKFYLKFEGMKVLTLDGKTLDMEVPDRMSYVGFTLR